jgi:hypothetical protein
LPKSVKQLKPVSVLSRSKSSKARSNDKRKRSEERLLNEKQKRKKPASPHRKRK